MRAIQFEHRLFATGATRTGKSTLIRMLFESVAAPKGVIDPADSSLTALPGAVTFRDPARVPDVPLWRFVPADPDDTDAYDRVFSWCFDRPPFYVWLDEPDQAARASGYPRQANRYVVQGAKRPCGFSACATRPRNVMKSMVAMASHAFIFDLPIFEDRKYLADNIGLPIATFEAARAEANALAIDTPDGPKKGFLWWNQLANILTVFPPLSLPR